MVEILVDISNVSIWNFSYSFSLFRKQSDTFIPYTKTRVVAAKKIKDNVQKLSSR